MTRVGSRPTTVANASVRILWSSQISNVTFWSESPTCSPSHGQPDAEHRTPARAVLDGYLPLVFGSQTPGDEQPESISWLLLVALRPPPDEAPEDRLALLDRDTGTSVVDLDQRVVAVAHRSHGDGSPGGRELGGVVDQLRHHLGDP